MGKPATRDETQPRPDVVLSADEYEHLMVVICDWMFDDIEGNGPTEFPATAEDVLAVLEAHGTGDIDRDVRSTSSVRITRSKPVEPIVKWVGGKRGLLPQLEPLLPAEVGEDYAGRLVEPFAGGLAMFFHLQPREAILADMNGGLVNLYKQVSANPDDLMLLLDALAARPHSAEVYYEVRSSTPRDSLGQAARFLYLNRYGFNGLYRENSKGQFNVAFGRSADGGRPALYEESNLRAASELLGRAELRCAPFERTLQRATESDFLYLDPPYEPLEARAGFTRYTSRGFDLGDQRRVRDAVLRLHRRTEGEATVMLSNSSAPRLLDLYSAHPDLTIHEVRAPRSVAPTAKGRGSVREVVITNYAVPEGVAA